MVDKSKIDYYYQYDRYFDFLKSSRKWIDLLWSKEAAVSIGIAIAFAVIVREAYQVSPIADFLNGIRTALITLGAALLGVLGFLIGGLAIISGTISNKILKKINSEEKFNHLMEIVFTFYFDGSLIGVTLLNFITLYFCSYTDWLISAKSVFFITLFSGYLFWFSVIYSIMLLGTCLRLLLLSCPAEGSFQFLN